MKTINVAAIGAAGISAVPTVAARDQMETTASPNGPQAEAVRPEWEFACVRSLSDYLSIVGKLGGGS